MKLFLSYLFCLIAAVAFGQPTSKNPKSFVPNNWKLLQQVDGDLNNDGVADAVLLVENSLGNKAGTYTRLVDVLLKSQPVYTLSFQVDKPIPDNDPNTPIDVTNALKIENGVLIIRVGISAGEFVQHYSYQNKDFVLIRATQTETAGTKTAIVDYDLVSGKLTIDKKDSSNPSADSKVEQDRKIPTLPTLKDFDPATYMGLFHLLGAGDAKPVTAQTTSDSQTIIVSADEMTGEQTEALVTLDDASMDKCLHIIFSREDYGSAEVNLGLRERLLWKELIIGTGSEAKVNPKYKGKDFKIVYTEKKGTPCGSTKEVTIKVIEQFSLANQ